MSDHGSKARWGQPLTGIISGAIFLLIALVTWYIFSSPQGIFKFYEQPMLEFLAWMILVGLWQHMLFGDWPFAKLKPLTRGIVELCVNVVAVYVIIYGVFGAFLGKVILPLWSVDALVARGIAEETAKGLVGGALTMVVLMGFFTYAFWTIIFKKWPWAGKLDQPAAGMAEWGWTTVVTLLAYGCLIIPFYVGVALKQPMAAQAPWWGGIDGVSHLYYIVGIWEWMVVYLFMTANVWSGQPFSLIKKQPWGGIVALISIVLLSYITCKISVAGMGAVWGPVNPKAADGPTSLAWRYYNSASLAGFALFPFLIWNHYFDNWPQKWGSVVGWFVRTIGVFVAAAVQFYIYYALCLPLLGLKPEFSNEANKPLVWLFWAIIPLLFNDWFMGKYPFYKSVEEHVHVSDSKGVSN